MAPRHTQPHSSSSSPVMSRISAVMPLLLLLLLSSSASAHFQIVYPAWRGNTLRDDMQWQYPCGGQKVTTNRTNWPTTGGALSVIPGWNAGHPTSFFYINMGFGTEPPNMTNVINPVFQITAPSKDPFPGVFCLPQLPLPKNATVKPGDNATIQVIQVALHGASLYNCADITFVEPGAEDPMPEGMCVNSSTIGFNLVYSTSDAYALTPRVVLAAVAVLGTVGWLAAIV